MAVAVKHDSIWQSRTPVYGLHMVVTHDSIKAKLASIGVQPPEDYKCLFATPSGKSNWIITRTPAEAGPPNEYGIVCPYLHVTEKGHLKLEELGEMLGDIVKVTDSNKHDNTTASNLHIKSMYEEKSVKLYWNLRWSRVLIKGNSLTAEPVIIGFSPS